MPGTTEAHMSTVRLQMILEIELSVACLDLSVVLHLATCDPLFFDVPTSDVKYLGNDKNLAQAKRAHREAMTELVR